MASRAFPIDDSTRVSEVRRNAVKLAEGEGLGASAASNAAIIATELATNLLKHAVRGEIHLSALRERGQKGVEILSIDRGPGIRNLSSCLADGYSSVGTAGTGLGAVKRLSTVFDAYSELGRGSVFVSRLQARADNSFPLPPIILGAVSRPIGSETISGDAWAVKYTGDCVQLLIADGLGHGPLAADASGAAVGAFRESAETAPAAMIQQIHAALKGTRGAAIAVALLDYEKAECRFAGIGNIAGRVMSPESTWQMVSHVGTAGYEARRFQEFTYKLPRSGVVVMHSDGLTSSWSLESYAGLLSHDPALIAAVLYRDSARGRDDACAIAAKWRNL